MSLRRFKKRLLCKTQGQCGDQHSDFLLLQEDQIHKLKMIFYDEIGIESLDFDDFDSAFLKKFIGLLHSGKFDHASGPAGHKVASIKRGKVSRTNKDLELFQKKKC